MMLSNMAVEKVALVEFYSVTEGRYVCANGGNCTSPGVCECMAGWIGFDCRTPICSQVRFIVGHINVHYNSQVSC